MFFEGFWRILNDCGRFGGFWRILEDFGRFWRILIILEDFEGLGILEDSGGFWSRKAPESFSHRVPPPRCEKRCPSVQIEVGGPLPFSKRCLMFARPARARGWVGPPPPTVYPPPPPGTLAGDLSGYLKKIHI